MLMRRYGYTPKQVLRLPPLWRERLLLLESYETQVQQERQRKAKQKAR